MKAIVCTQYGPPEVLQLREVEKPAPKANQLLVRVYATAVNSADWRLRAAVPSAIRLFFGLTKPRRPILGGTFAGIVEQTGKAVDRFKPGDSVFGMTGMSMGTYAEYVCVSQDGCVTVMPKNIDYTASASVPFGATTALHFLEKSKLVRGERLLIYGASGAVGSAAVQLAKYLGAEVTAVCSAANLHWVQALGADRVIDYAREDFTKHDARYDVLFETVNKLPYAQCKRLLQRGGRLILGAAGFADMLKGAWASAASSVRVLTGAAPERQESVQFIRELIEQGAYVPVIDKTYLLPEMAEAHRYVQQGHKKGNVVVEMNGRVTVRREHQDRFQV